MQVSCSLSKAAVRRIAKAWNDLDADPEEAAQDIANLLHHPWWADAKNKTHMEMMDYVKTWLEEQQDEREEVLGRCELSDRPHGLSSLSNNGAEARLHMASDATWSVNTGQMWRRFATDRSSGGALTLSLLHTAILEHRNNVRGLKNASVRLT